MLLLVLAVYLAISFFALPSLNSYLSSLVGKDSTPIIIVLTATLMLGFISVLYWNTERSKTPDQRESYWRFVSDIARENLLFWLWFWFFLGILFFRPTISAEGDSMEPVLQDEDRLAYSPFSYIGVAPQRGDIVLYMEPNSKDKFFGRIVGLPGEEIAILNGALFVNGKLMNESYINYETVSATSTQRVVVKAHNYALIGDSRDGLLNTIEPKQILGKVYFRYRPLTRLGFLPEAHYTDSSDFKGERIAFVSAQDEILKIAIADLDRVSLVVPINFNCPVWHPTWSPDGNQIAFFADCGGNEEIYVMTIGEEVTRLTEDPSIDGYPAWSPDGSRIAFSSNRDGDWEIYSINPNRNELTKLTDNSSDEYWPTWSPDSANIAFVSNRDDSFEIYKMKADGTQQVRLTDDPAYDSLPDWSSDGTRIAFTSDRTGDRELYVMNIDGSSVTQITNTQGKDFAPDWSVDSSKIVFVSERNGGEKIFVMNADGTDVRQLPYSTGREGRPVWQPFVVTEAPTEVNESTPPNIVNKTDATSQEAPSWLVTLLCIALWGSGVIGWRILYVRARSRSNRG